MMAFQLALRLGGAGTGAELEQSEGWTGRERSKKQAVALTPSRLS